MLVLARSAGQSVVLDDRITVTVLATHGGIVRLGISAPGDVGVRRGELDRHPPASRPHHGADPADPADLADPADPADPVGAAGPVGGDAAPGVVHAGDVSSPIPREGSVTVAPGVVDVTGLRSKSSPSG
jgi:carbon storage regulator CsrA